MDKMIEKGNLIDFFGILMPGMICLIVFYCMNPNVFVFSTGNTLISGLTIAVVFLIVSYTLGLIQSEFSVFLQTHFPRAFNFTQRAAECFFMTSKIGSGCPSLVDFKWRIFRDDPIFHSSSDVNELKMLIKSDYTDPCEACDHIKFWLITHGFNSYVERKAAYNMMNRSLTVIPIIYVIINPFIYIFIQRPTDKTLTFNKWFLDGSSFCGSPVWKYLLLILFFIIIYVRTYRLARIHIWEFGMTYLEARKTNSDNNSQNQENSNTEKE